MKDQFYLHFDTMPTTTAQQKGVYVKNGRPFFYEKEKVKVARQQFIAELLPHIPPKPSELPIKLTVWFAFDVKNKNLWGHDVDDTEEPWTGHEYKPTRPDTENSLKLLKDCMTGLFFVDDSQVVDERIIKTYAEKATIMIRWEEVYPKGGKT